MLLNNKSFSHPTIAEYRNKIAASNYIFRRNDFPASDVPLVSIVTSVFNGAQTLQRTFDSVRAQQWPRLEYIVVDANSTDETRQIVEANMDLVTTYYREPDGGIYDGMNKGVALAKGDVIKVTNADDMLTPNSIGRAISQLEKSGDPKNTIVYSHLDIINDRDEVVDQFTTRWIVKSVPAFLHPSWYVPREVYEELGLYSLDLNVASDYEYYLYARRTCFFELMTEPLAQYRTQGRSHGFEGVGEGIRINRHYLPWHVRQYVALVYLMQKLRKKLLLSLFGEKGFYAIKRMLGR